MSITLPPPGSGATSGGSGVTPIADDTPLFRAEPGHAVKPGMSRSFLRTNRGPLAVWASVAGLLILFLLVVILWAPKHLATPAPTASDLRAMNAKERADVSINYSNAKNSVRTTLIQAIAGAAFFATAFFAWRQVTVARAAQSTDRFTKSIERLGDESSAVRLGSVYTLEELGNDATYARQVAHVLVAFIREVSDESSATNVAAGVGTIGSSSASPVPNVSLAPYDVREAASIIAARGLWRRAVGTQLDLSFTLLRGVDLSGADLTGIDLRSTDLAYADLRKAVLADADLRGAKLISANLDGATLHHAKLTGADLEHASLRGAVGRRVHFEYCVMTKVDLSSSTLVNCDFSNANLTEAAADGATLTGSVFYDATLVLANFQNADLTDSNLLGADLRGVTWTDAVRERMKGVSPAPNEGS